jgi:serine/threonine-protein kinase HipA
LKRLDLVDYFGRDRLQLTNRVISKVLLDLRQLHEPWRKLVAISFLSAKMREKYLNVLEERFERLF